MNQSPLKGALTRNNLQSRYIPRKAYSDESCKALIFQKALDRRRRTQSIFVHTCLKHHIGELLLMRECVIEVIVAQAHQGAILLMSHNFTTKPSLQTMADRA